MHPKDLKIEDFSYQLPEEKIAKFPAPERDQSKLLIYDQGQISSAIFKDLPQLLDSGYRLVLNKTKVIPARIWFKKPSGATIEVFCLNPTKGSQQDAMYDIGHTTWQCFIGNNKRWKEGETLTLVNGLGTNPLEVRAKKMGPLGDAFIIEFHWQPAHLNFSEVLEQIGQMPLPPYFKRTTELADKERYQTVFAQTSGSVAAPTAGLHFTQDVLNRLKEKGVEQSQVTLHVGAGTFRPVTSTTMDGHQMHAEEISVNTSAIRELLTPKKNIPVGTTAMRTLESLYWLGVALQSNADVATNNLEVGQWVAYGEQETLSVSDSLQALLQYAAKHQLEKIEAKTSIIIAPGYRFKICNGLITNFHQPNSTLLLLVAALIGDDWRRVYEYALQNNFRFLSYGDSSILLPAVQ